MPQERQESLGGDFCTLVFLATEEGDGFDVKLLMDGGGMFFDPPHRYSHTSHGARTASFRSTHCNEYALMRGPVAPTASCCDATRNTYARTGRAVRRITYSRRPLQLTTRCHRVVGGYWSVHGSGPGIVLLEC